LNEQVFAIIVSMDDALELLDLAVAGVAMFPPARLLDDDLRRSVVSLQGHIDRLKVLHAGLVHEADRRRVWAGRYRDVADWLADQTKTSRGDAASRARLGAALKASPKLQEAAENGDVSAATAESLFDAVTDRPDGASDADVDQLVDACKGADPRDAKNAADTWKQQHSVETPEAAEARRYANRSLRTRNLGDGMGQLTAVLPLIDLRQVTNSISHVAGTPCESDTRTTEQRLADGLVQLCIAYAKGQVTGGREKPTLLLTIPADTYTGGSDGDGFTAHGDRVPAHVVRFLAEQATLQRVVTAGNQIVNVGRAERYATDTQYKALVVRDGGCRWPGCRLPAAWCDIDHLHAWEHGGTTDLDNLVMWCRHHHTLKHTPGVTVTGSVGDDLAVHLPDGTLVHCPPQDRTAQQRPRTTAPPPTKAAA
jgi:hypothetical protein